MRKVDPTRVEDLEALIRSGRAGWAPLPVGQTIPRIVVPQGAKQILVKSKTGCIILTDADEPITSVDPFVFDWADKINRGTFRNHVQIYEGNIQHMYLDAEFNVTVGIGHLLKDEAAAEALPFYRRHSRNNNPHPLHIGNAFKKVRKNTALAKSGALAFKDLTYLDLDLTDIEAIFEDDVRGFIEQLKGEYPDFFSYPGLAQMGMLDLIYNMGHVKFFKPNFRMFREALVFRNWLRVAEESHRDNEVNGVKNDKIEDRNIIVNKWFLDAMDVEPFFINVDCPYKRLSEFVF